MKRFARVLYLAIATAASFVIGAGAVHVAIRAVRHQRALDAYFWWRIAPLLALCGLVTGLVLGISLEHKRYR